MSEILGKRFLYILFTVFVWCVFLWSVASISPLFLEYTTSFPYSETLPRTGLPSWIYSWANFDGVHYLTIVRDGYRHIGLIQAFFPTYPLLIEFISAIGVPPIIAGMVISIVSLVLLINAYLILYDRETKEVQSRLILLLLLWPASFFLQAVYTESFFLLTILYSFIFAKRGSWFLAGCLAAVASATRVVGVFLVPALLVEWWIQRQILPETGTELWLLVMRQKYSAVKKIVKKIDKVIVSEWQVLLSVLSGVLGVLTYSIYLWSFTGDFLYFFHVQSEFGGGRQESLILFPQVIWRYLKIFATYQTIDPKLFAIVFEFFTAVIGVLVLLYATLRTRLSWIIFGWAAFLLPTLTGTFSSLPRYLIVVFPFWVVLAQIVARFPRAVQVVLFLLSTLCLLYTTMLFVQGYWVA